jgi:hypothetical protein
MIGVRLTIILTVVALTPVLAWSNALLEEALFERLAETGPDEFIHVDLIMADRVKTAEMEAVLEGASSYVRRDYVIRELKAKADEAQAELRGRLDAAEAEGSAYDVRYIWLNNTVTLFAAPDLIQELLTREDVERVHYDPGRVILFGLHENDLYGYSKYEAIGKVHAGGRRGRDIAWGVGHIGADDAWAGGYTGEGVLVAVLDSGCDIYHPDLENRVWVNPGETPDNEEDDDDNGYVDDVYGWNFEDNDNDVVNDLSVHGTHVTGTVCGDGTEGTDTGVAPDAEFMTCVIVPAAKLGRNGFEANVWAAMEYALDNGADIINMSAGLYHFQNPDRATWRETCEDLMTAGIVLVFAAGNGRDDRADGPPDEIATPADVPGVISLTATDDEDVLWEGTSRGPTTWEDVDPYYDFDYPPGLTKPDFSAPGVDIISTKFGADEEPFYNTMTGTSMASPHAAGLAALILEAVPGLTNDQVYESMEETAEDLGYITGMDNDTGWGLIQCLDAIYYAENEWGRGANGGFASERLEKEIARVTLESCTPNPVRTGPAVVNYYVDEGFEGSVTVRVYDITGREVREIRDDNPVPGPNAVKVTTDGLGSGVYIVNLSAEGNSAAVKLVVIR